MSIPLGALAILAYVVVGVLVGLGLDRLDRGYFGGDEGVDDRVAEDFVGLCAVAWPLVLAFTLLLAVVWCWASIRVALRRAPAAQEGDRP